MASLPAFHYDAVFPASVKNVLVVVNGFQEPRALAATLAAMHERESVRLHLLAVRLPPSGHALAFLKRVNVKRLLREDGLKELRPLRQLLDASRTPYKHHIEFGSWCDVVSRFAEDNCCKRVVIGNNESSLLRDFVLRHDAWRIRVRLGRAGYACEMA